MRSLGEAADEGGLRPPSAVFWREGDVFSAAQCKGHGLRDPAKPRQACPGTIPYVGPTHAGEVSPKLPSPS